MEVVNMKIGDIKPYEKNPRKNDDAVRFVANSIKEFGFKQPIIVDENNVIIAGHTRYKAAIELGMDEVPAVVADDLTPEQAKALRIADNKTGEKATWDNDLLGEELKDILGDFDMTDFGFGDFEIAMLTEDFTPEPFDESEIAQYNGEVGLAKKRVIITYTDEEEVKVERLLGVEKISKVVYDITEVK